MAVVIEPAFYPALTLFRHEFCTAECGSATVAEAQHEGRDAGDEEAAQLSGADGTDISQTAPEDSGEKVGELGQTAQCRS